MGYELVDLILRTFARRYELYLYTVDKENEPRRSFSFEKSGWQMWVTVPNEHGNFQINICRSGKKETLQSFSARPETLAEILEHGLQIIRANGGES